MCNLRSIIMAFMMIFYVQDSFQNSWKNVHQMGSNANVLESATLLVSAKLSKPEKKKQLVLAQLAIYLSPRIIKKWLTKGYPTIVTLTALLQGNIKFI